MVGRLRKMTTGKPSCRMWQSKAQPGVHWVCVEAVGQKNGRKTDFLVSNRFDNQEQAQECYNSILAMI